MQILPVSFYGVRVHKGECAKSVNTFTSVPKTENCGDVVSFSGVAHGGNYLRRLASYGLPDMYTGKRVLDPLILEQMLQRGVFRKDIARVVKTVSKYEDTLQPVEAKFFNLIKRIARVKPNINLQEAVNLVKKPHEERLLQAQQRVFEELISQACDMPPKLFKEFSELMHITNKRLYRDPVVIPFSEKEFNYKLKKISSEILSRNNRREVRDMFRFMRNARELFPPVQGRREPFGRNKYSIKKKLDAQMKPEVLKNNSEKLQKLRKFLQSSSLKNNTDLKKLLNETSARIHGYPYVEQFARKSFIHDIHKIINQLDNEALAEKMRKTVLKLPTAKESLSAFIVKFSDSDSSRIGYHMLKNSCASVDHLVAKNNGGRNHLANFGLCAAGINSEKTNIDFDKWIRMHPQTRKNCQKYVNSLIDLYYRGILEKVGLTVDYITDFAQTIRKISPKENPINLDLSALGLY